MIDAAIAERIRAACRQAPCIESLRIDLLELSAGSCRILAGYDPAFDGLNRGFFHGGMLAAVADCVAWAAIVTQTGPEERMVTTDVHLRYLNPCAGAATFTGRVIKLGRTLCPVHVDAFDPAGQHVLTGQVTYLRIEQLRAV